ncbi:hypothetical protein PMAYCL1PPCAC_29644, partial [Pristionchus mayeri]
MPHGSNEKESFVYLRGLHTIPRTEEEDTVSIGEFADSSLNGEFEEALRKVSFSSIASFDTRNKYISALDTLREATFPHLLLTRKPLRQSSKFSPLSSPSSSSFTMDSPSDLSPNAPPGGIERYPADQFAVGAAVAAAARNDGILLDEIGRETTSGNDSEDSSGFEKVDPNSDLLADYSTNFHHQMQQSLYGQLSSDPSARSQGVDLLGDFEERPMESSHHGVDDILEHHYDKTHEKV